VNIDEAYRELGLAEDADADTVRRAYLRLLKTRKPEVDPDGFQRLREAYELAKDSAPVPTPTASPPPSGDGEAEARVIELTGFDVTAFFQALEGDNARAAAKLIVEHDDWQRDHLPVGPCLHVLLQLHQKGQLRLARRLQSKIADSHALADRGAWDSPEVPAMWSLARELGELDSDFPHEVREAIASGVLCGDLREARPKLRELRAENPARANLAELLLRQHAPSLHRVFANALYTPRDNTRASSGARLWPFWSVAVLGMAVLRMCGSSSGSSQTHQEIANQFRVETRQPSLHEQEEFRSLATQGLKVLQREAESVPHSENLVANTKALSAALSTWQCNDIVPAAHEVKVTVWSKDHDDFTSLRPTTLKLLQNVSRLCHTTAGSAGLTEVTE